MTCRQSVLVIFCAVLSPFLESEAAWTASDLTPKNYNPSRVPQANDSQPLEVKLYLKVLSMLEVSEVEQSLTVDIVYKLSWTDYRLKLPAFHAELYPIVLDMSWKEKIWVPDVYVRNALKLTTLDGTIGPVTYLEVNPENSVSLIARLTAKVICDMELFAYPHDTQSCYLDSKSLSYNVNQMVLTWDEFTVDESIYFPKFRIDEHFSRNICDKPAVRRSCVRGVLKLSRKVSFYITRFYAPTLLITTAAFISYWMPAGEIAPRVVVNMTPFLTLVTLHNALNNEINVSYVVALHIWMFLCMFYTFMGLVVLFFAMQFHAAHKRRQQDEERQRMMQENNNLFRTLRTCVSEPGTRALESGDTEIQVESNQRRRSSLKLGNKKNKNSPPAWVTKGHMTWLWRSRQTASSWSRTRLRRLHPMKWAAGQKDGYVNPADRVARILGPTTFAAFAASYFIVFCNYSDALDGADGGDGGF